ncbi:MAG: ergothioneine biosynthesis protein EgtB, partial [Betaproteobacteria bacterium]
VNPPLWELAHVGWFQEHWCLRWRDGAVRSASLLADADPMLNSALIPHRHRWDLPQLTWPLVRDYMARVLDATIERVQRSAPTDRYFFLLALFHEDMHAEAYRMSLQTLALPGPAGRHAVGSPSSPPPAAREVRFAGGQFVLGARPGPDFVFDNEQDAHEVFVQPFALATATVTRGEFRQFVEAGGYSDRHWWSEAGWSWRERAGAVKPRHWERDGAGWLVRRFDVLEPLVDADAMVHVNAYEAEAYAAFAGARLPSEAEWEYAARAGLDSHHDRYPWGAAPAERCSVNLDDYFGRPVASAALPGSDSPTGLRQLLGNVWEWTSSPFLPYPGFAPGPYREYSQPWFGDHRVLRGGSFATRSRLVHNRWRNFYTPERNDVFAGIRLARGV